MSQQVWSHTGKHLPHCPNCGAFVSPKTGVCNAGRCSHTGKQVVEPTTWPPESVKFTNDADLWGEPVQAEVEQGQPATAAAPSPAINWDRILELESKLEQTAWHIAKQIGGDAEELFSAGQMAVIEKAQCDPGFLAQKDAYITTFAAWRMRDHLDPRWAERNSDPLEPMMDVGMEPATSNFAEQSLTFQAIADTLTPEEMEIVDTIQHRGEEVLHRDGTLNVNALARKLNVSSSTMYRRVDTVQDILGAELGLGY
jgi:ribosomal protein L32